jgi:hypothetical protein
MVGKNTSSLFLRVQNDSLVEPRMPAAETSQPCCLGWLESLEGPHPALGGRILPTARLAQGGRYNNEVLFNEDFMLSSAKVNMSSTPPAIFLWQRQSLVRGGSTCLGERDACDWGDGPAPHLQPLNTNPPLASSDVTILLLTPQRAGTARVNRHFRNGDISPRDAAQVHTLHPPLPDCYRLEHIVGFDLLPRV